MALTKRVTHGACVAGVFTLTLSDVAGLEVGYTIVVRGLGQHYDGTRTIASIDETAVEITFVHGNQSHPEVTSPGVLYVPVVWATDADLETFIGYTPTDSGDAAFVTMAVEAANEFAWRRRQSAGYATDLPDAVPSPDVLLGTILYAGNLYRQRGTIGETLAAFDPMGTAAPVGSTAEILRLLGINRARIA